MLKDKISKEDFVKYIEQSQEVIKLVHKVYEASGRTIDIINLEDIIVIAGEIDKGFIITDANGHIYLITSVNGQQANIMRLTVKDTGPEEGGNNNG